ncbi:hypothetical protein ACS0TY_010001 [Phlomoides rotata]
MMMVGELESLPHWEDQHCGKSKAPTRWLKPPRGVSKLNTNAAMYRDGTAGLGFIVRNEEGHVMLAGTKRIAVGGSSNLVEAMAILYGLQRVVE